MATYPAALHTFIDTTGKSGVALSNEHIPTHTELADELTAVQVALGVNPQGAEASVAAAIAAKADASGQFAVNTVAVSGAAVTLPATHAAHRVTLTANCTFTFTSPTAGHAFILRLTGAFTPTFPASVKWPGGTAPTYASAGTTYHFVTLDAGVSWQGTGQAHS